MTNKELYIEKCCEYIQNNIDSILPFKLLSGFRFGITMSKSTYYDLPEKYKLELGQYSSSYDKKNYYIFRFHTKRALCLKTNFVEILEYNQFIVFMAIDEFSEFIRLNIGLDTKKSPIIPEENNTYYLSQIRIDNNTYIYFY